jgi:hypothetical protein
VRDLQVDDSGHAIYGYEQVLVEGFTAQFGIDPRELPNDDPRWVRYRAHPHTEFMRSLRKLRDEARSGLPIAVMVHHPWGYRGGNPTYADNLRGMLLAVAFGLGSVAPAATVHLVEQEPVRIRDVAPGVILVDFERVAFGNLRLRSSHRTKRPSRWHSCRSTGWPGCSGI